MVPEIFGNKPATEKKRALGKGRDESQRKLGLKEGTCPFVANGRDYADGVFERVRQMPSVCLERCVSLEAKRNPSQRKARA